MTPWLLGTLVVAGSAWHWGHGPALGADDHGQYLLHARALVEGRAYTDIGFINTPLTTLIGPVAEPPGLPLLIAGIFATLGESVTAVRVLLALSLWLVGLAVWQYWRRLEDETVALIVSLWTVVVLLRVHVVDTVLADLPFAAALWLVFLLMDAPQRVHGVRHYVTLALVGAFAFSFRMAALPLLPAMLTYVRLVPGADRRRLLAVGGVWALSAIGVMFLLPGAAALGSEVARTPADFAHDLVVNAGASLQGARRWIPIRLAPGIANTALHAAFLLVAAYGAAVALRDNPRRFSYLTAAWYLVMLATIPTGSGRYLWPLYPMITFAFIRGLRSLCGLLRLRVRPAWGLAGAGVVLGTGSLQDALGPQPRALSNVPEAREIVAALQREAQATPVRAAFFSPRVLTWETGIAATAFSSGTPDEIYKEVRRVGLTHVVVGDAGTYDLGREATAAMVAQNAGSFEPLLANKSFVLYKLRPATEPGR